MPNAIRESLSLASVRKCDDRDCVVSCEVLAPLLAVCPNRIAPAILEQRRAYAALCKIIGDRTANLVVASLARSQGIFVRRVAGKALWIRRSFFVEIVYLVSFQFCSHSCIRATSFDSSKYWIGFVVVICTESRFYCGLVMMSISMRRLASSRNSVMRSAMRSSRSVLRISVRFASRSGTTTPGWRRRNEGT